MLRNFNGLWFHIFVFISLVKTVVLIYVFILSVAGWLRLNRRIEGFWSIFASVALVTARTLLAASLITSGSWLTVTVSLIAPGSLLTVAVSLIVVALDVYKRQI